jgi:ATP-binding cassette subfamily C protein
MTPRPLVRLAADVRAIVGWRLWGTTLVMTGTALTSGLSIAILVPLVQAAGVASRAGAEPSWLGRAIAAVTGSGVSLELALALFVAVSAGHGALGWLQTRAIAHVTQAVMTARRRRLFAAICRARWAFFARQRPSALLDALIRQTDRIGFAAHALLTLAASSAVAAVYVALALSVSVPLTLLALAAGTAITIALASRRRRASRAGEALTAADAALHASLADALASMKLVQSYNAAPRHIAAVDRTLDDLRATHLRLVGGPVAIRLWFDLGAAAALAVAAYIGVRHLAMPPADLVVLVVVFLRLTPQLSYLQVYYHGLLTDLPAFESVTRLEQACLAEAREPAPAAPPPLSWERSCAVEDVTVRYGTTRALEGASILIPAGGTVAVVGPSGAGKTTLADVVLGLLQPEHGGLRVDGRLLAGADLPGWRAQIGYVPQDPFLFNGTIRENLEWAAPGAPDDELRTALELAAATFVFQLPDGLDTRAGDRGGLLSGGERQRIALARALLRRPRLLVLDEATSALDAENEALIRGALDRLRGRMAVLVIAHRLASVQTADRIYVLEGGRVVEEGSWPQLMAKPQGRLRALCLAQQIDVTADRPTDRAASPVT